jgi:hypothetical protein
MGRVQAIRREDNLRLEGEFQVSVVKRNFFVVNGWPK